jgi:dTDP-glucose 4,6-dehydratase
MVILLTGGAGFIGSHVAEHLLRNSDDSLVFLDRLDCSGNLNRLTEIAGWQKHRSRCRWIFHDLKAPISSQLAAQIGKVDSILHMAASTHVDRSITDPVSFVYDNVIGTAHLLEYARQIEPRKLLYFSTDEVFGPAPEGTAYGEWDRYNSGNPYSATKAGAEELCLAWHNTYKLPVLITHCMNVFGERQSPEKFVPMLTAKIRDGEQVTIHADRTRTKPGSRFYIHARNVADAVLFVLGKGKDGEKYNIVGEREVDNLSLARQIAELQGTTPHDDMYTCDFTAGYGYTIATWLQGRNQEYVQEALTKFKEAAQDMQATVVNARTAGVSRDTRRLRGEVGGGASHAKENVRPWWDRGDKVVARYVDDRKGERQPTDGSRLNLFTANTRP